MRKTISVYGARVNNLKNFDVEIPRDKLTIVTGVSGSGKSSLVYDIIFGEAQRKFLESMTSFARSRVAIMDKADVDSVQGLSPVVAIQQRRGIRNPRSTIGTMTEIANYLRLLFATIGISHCPYCGKEVVIKSANVIAEKLQSLPDGFRLELLAPISKIHGEDYEYLFDEIRRQGYRKVYIDDNLTDLSDEIELDESTEYQMNVLIDKFIIKRDIYKLLLRAVENTITMGNGFLQIKITDKNNNQESVNDNDFNNLLCPDHHILMGEQMNFDFSYNNPRGACVTCTGMGTTLVAKAYLVVSNPKKSLRQGALTLAYGFPVEGLAAHYGFSMDTPFEELPEKIKDIIFYGTKGEKFEHIDSKEYKSAYMKRNVGKKITYSGIVNNMNRHYRLSTKRGKMTVENSAWWRKHMAELTCPDCLGTQLRKEKLLVTIHDKNIYELGELSLQKLSEFLHNVSLPKDKEDHVKLILKEIFNRLTLLMEIGLEYLSINRKSETLSGGEEQRIRLSTQIGSELMGMLYVLDEPSIGLHQKDVTKVISTLKRLRDIGNTVIVVEHDLETILSADHVIEMGPGPGVHGGYIQTQGPLDTVNRDSKFLTGEYLQGKKKILLPKKRREHNGRYINIIGAKEHNLKEIDVNIPLGLFICISGVSGSGKSSLIHDILYKKLFSILRDPRINPGKHSEIKGIEHIDDIRIITQAPIGRNPRSNPSTYIGIYDKIRELFMNLPESKKRKYTKSYFSYNYKTGRCPECEGFGEKRTQLQFMPDIRTLCPVCKGKRYHQDILEIKYKGKSIADILDLTVEEALKFFNDVRLLKHKLTIMNQLGLGYLKLGQSSTTLSGGEAQRVKLAKELGKLKKKSNNLYILDEPTTGLHMHDIQKLLDCLNLLVDSGNTVICIEHHLDVIKTADYVFDLGPGAGEDGGLIVAEGTPEDIAKIKESYTGQYLKKMLENGGTLI